MKFTYSGPATTLCLKSDKGKVLFEGALHPHPERSVTLPDDHPHVVALETAGHLARAEKPAARASSPQPQSTEGRVPAGEE